MSDKALIQIQAKTPGVQGSGYIKCLPQAEQVREVEPPDLAVQPAGATRLGHSLEAISVAASASPILQRQEAPEEEEPELQREPEAVQRQEKPEEEEEREALQMQRDDQRVGLEGGKVPQTVESAINRARSGGQSLDGDLQVQMGEKLGHNFSAVRVHTDTEAHALNERLSAKAFTTGRDIFFRQGAYDPASSSGRELIGHELAHVIQQSTGLVHGGGSGMIVRPAGDAFEREADAHARIDVSYVPPHHSFNNSFVMRHCWPTPNGELGAQELASFTEDRVHLIHPFGAAGGQYSRFQRTAGSTQSSYFGVWLPKYEQFVERGRVDPHERQELAIRRDWTPEWRYLVKYHGGMNGYAGHVNEQRDISGERFAGGGLQVVFPENNRPAFVQAIPIVEETANAGP